MAKTNIEWADMSWNVVVGCTRVSSGCANCYAEAIQRRFTPRDQPTPPRWIPGNETVTLHPERLEQPKTWKKGRTIFVCSMADLFHGNVPDAYIKEVFQVMAGPECAQHTFLLLTKRPERMLQLAHLLPWPANIWAGTSVESQYWADRRIPLLAQVPAAIRFLSCEPLLRPVKVGPELDRYNRSGWPGSATIALSTLCPFSSSNGEGRPARLMGGSFPFLNQVFFANKACHIYAVAASTRWKRRNIRSTASGSSRPKRRAIKASLWPASRICRMASN